MRFKAAMFDFDGTITEKGRHSPPQEMANALVELANRMPIAFCTGRQLESFENRGLNVLLEEIEPDKREHFLENLYLMAENGSVGYKFNTELHQFEEFYRAAWPEEFINKELLKARLAEVVREYGSVYHNAHRVIVVIRTNLHDEDDRDMDEVYGLSDKIYDETVRFLLSIDQGFEKHLHVGNSGIGVVVCPADGDKDNGIKRFAEFLEKSKGLKFGPEAREIMVVGDRPQKGGNDEYFLNGKYGTAFTVGDLVEGVEWPRPVYDDHGKRLLHWEGTMNLVNNLLIN